MPHQQSSSISYPTPVNLPSHKRQPSVKSHKSKQSSLSGTMSWLSGNKSPKTPYTAASPPLRISEPKLNDAFGRVEQAPTVTIVRTPQEALTYMQQEKDKAKNEYVESLPKRSTETQRSQTDAFPSSRNPCPSPPTSPPLPPLPEISRSSHRSPVRPTIKPPPQMSLPQVPRPVPSPSRSKASYPSTLNDYTMVPPMETAPPSPLPPSFDPVLLSTVPSPPIDPKNTIITLETSTGSLKTTMATLISREGCHFNEYFSNILTEARKKQHSQTSSVYSQSSGIEENLDSINSIFANHISASGLLAPTSATFHVFLDRPSAPYTHILAYLRTPPSPDQPGVLPRAVRLSHNYLPARVETLLELRDEANFLNLQELVRLCTEEINKFTSFAAYSKSNASTSASVKSSKRPSITHAQSHHQLGIKIKTLSTHSQLTEDPNEIDPCIPTPNSSAPSSREGSRHESTATPTPTPCLSQLRGHGKSFSNVHPLPSSKSTSALRNDPSMTMKARPSPAWL